MSERDPELSRIRQRLDNLASLHNGKLVSRWMTTHEAAEYLRCSTRKIEDLTRRGLLPFSRMDPTSPKSPRLYHRRHLDKYLLSGKNPVTQRLSPAER